MVSLWTAFCGRSDCRDADGTPCDADLISFTHPSSCINHVLIICLDVLLLIMFFLFTMFSKTSSKSSFRKITSLQLLSAIYNGLLGFAYLSSGVWILEENLRKTRALLPLHWWVLFMLHGLIWSLMGLTVSLRGQSFPRVPLRLLSFLIFLFAAITCALSLLTAILGEEVMSIKIVLDMLSFVGSSLLVLCAYRGYRYEVDEENDVHDPLLSAAYGSTKSYSSGTVTPFENASFWSKYTFWWLNPLMKRGKERTLEDEDIPKMREVDQAESCYSVYIMVRCNGRGHCRGDHR